MVISVPPDLPPTEERVVVTARLPKSLVKALDKAVELGYFKSRNEAVNQAVEKMLYDLFFVTTAFEVARKRIENKKIPPNSQLPMEIIILNEALETLINNPPSARLVENWQVLVALTASFYKNKREEVEEFARLLDNIFKKSE